MTDILREELMLDPLGLGYAGQSDKQAAWMLNQPRHTEGGITRSRAEYLGLGFITEAEVAAALADEGPDTIDPDPGPEPVPGDKVTTLRVMEARPGEVVYEIAQAFKQGEVPHSLVAIHDDEELPTQVDKKVLWPDGSIRHALIAIQMPDQVQPEMLLDLIAYEEWDATPLAVPGNLTVIVRPLDGAPVTYTMEPASEFWRAGPLVVEHRSEFMVPKRACGSDGMRLIMDLTTAADDTRQASITMANDIAMDAGTTEANYDITVRFDTGTEATYEVRGQLIFSRFVRTVTDNGATTQAFVAPDVERLADLGLAPRYDWKLGLSTTAVSYATSSMADPTWDTPLSFRGVTPYMAMAGGRGDIGYCPIWVTDWLIDGALGSGNGRLLLDHCMGKSEALQGCNWNYWNGEKNHLVTTLDYPDLWADTRDERWKPYYSPREDNTMWWPEGAHHPACHPLLYLHTGRRVLLDGLMAQAAWCIVSLWPYIRESTDAVTPSFGLFFYNQVRGGAWRLRDIAYANYLTPDSDEHHADYFRQAMTWNAERTAEQIPGWMEQTEAFGYGHPHLTNGEDTGMIPPWQVDMLNECVTHTVIMGASPGWQPVLDWLANFAIKRFQQPDFPPYYGTALWLYMYRNETDPSGVVVRIPYPTWGEAAAKQATEYLPQNWQESNSEDDYVTRALCTLATMDDAGVPGAREAFDWLRMEDAPRIDVASLRENVRQLNVVPAGFTRAVPD